MNHLLKKTLLAVAGAALAAQTASAAGNSYTANSDVLLMFKDSGAANDIIFDLGSISQFTSGASFNLSTVGYNSSLLSAANFGLSSLDLTTLQWTLVASVSSSNPQGVAVTDEGGNINSFGNNTAATGAAGSVNNSGSAYSAILGSGILAAGHPGAVKMAQGTSGSFSSNGDDLAGTLNTPTGQGATINNSDFSGLASATLEKFVGTGAAQALGNVTFDETTGQMLYTSDVVAAPEPAAYGMLAGAGLLALSLGRQFGRRKLA